MDACPRTSPLRSARSSSTAWSLSGPAACVLIGEACRRVPTPRHSPVPRSSARVRGAELVGRRFTAPVRVLRRHARTPLSCLAGDFVAIDEGTGHSPDGARFRRGRPTRLRGGRDRRHLPGRRPGSLHDEVADLAGLQVFEANAAIIAALRNAGACADRGVHPQLPALLADRHAPHLPGDDLVVGNDVLRDAHRSVQTGEAAHPSPSRSPFRGLRRGSVSETVSSGGRFGGALRPVP